MEDHRSGEVFLYYNIALLQVDGVTIPYVKVSDITRALNAGQLFETSATLNMLVGIANEEYARDKMKRD